MTIAVRKRADRFVREIRANSAVEVFQTRTRESGDDDRRGPGDDVEPGGVGVFAHQLVLVDELQHEDQDEGQKDAVQDLGEDAEFDQREVRDEDDGGAGEEEQAVEPVEELASRKPLSRPLSKPRPSQTV